MKRKVVLLCTAVVLLLVGSVMGGLLTKVSLAEPDGLASVPPVINYQGTLLNPVTGNPVSDGQYQFVLSVYDSNTGGSVLWQELQDVTVQDGLFSVLLGYANPLEPAFFDGSPRYLGIKVGADEEMTPRQLLVSVPYAFHAQNTHTLDGYTAATLPIEWTNLVNVPGGFADGVDNDTTYTAGTGLMLTGTQFSLSGSINADTLDGMDSADFALAGHDHDAAYVNEGQADSISSAMILDSDLDTADLKDGAVTYDKLGGDVKDMLAPAHGDIAMGPANDAELLATGYIQLYPATAYYRLVGGPGTWNPRTIWGGPSGRDDHTMVLTGSRMIVWGGVGQSGMLNTGGIYDAVTDTWTATNTTDAPSPRANHTTVWAGRKMIVWGGYDATYWLNTGGIYDPATDTWMATSTTDAPSPRADHTTVWDGINEMIVWGGYDGSSWLNTGGIYNMEFDGWIPMGTAGAPPSGRIYHTAVWTGSEMIVWGGSDAAWETLDTGGIYDPIGGWWRAPSTTGAPSARAGHTAVWTGSEMIVWGGYDGSGPLGHLGDGGRYIPGEDYYYYVKE